MGHYLWLDTHNVVSIALVVCSILFLFILEKITAHGAPRTSRVSSIDSIHVLILAISYHFVISCQVIIVATHKCQQRRSGAVLDRYSLMIVRADKMVSKRVKIN